MKKVLLLIVGVMICLTQVKAQSHRIVNNSSNSITLEVTTGDLQVENVKTAAGNFSQLTMEGAVNMVTNIGDPQLPMMVKTIEIPICGDLHVTATAGRVRTLTAYEAGIHYPIYPTQPLQHKSAMDEQEFVQNSTTYANSSNYGMPLATIEKAGIARNINLADIKIYPVQVNPVTRMVTIYDDITVTVTYDNVNMDATRELKEKYASPAFGRPAQVINTLEVAGVRDGVATVPVRYVIIANSMFQGQLDSLANWKRRKGFIVDVAYTSTIGTTTTAIKSYITGLFTNATATNPAPSYILLVGDQAQIPTYSGQTLNSHVTDLYYFTQVGSDNIPDCYWGRFSAQSIAQLTPQIEKTLNYEQLTMADPTYLDRCLLVAGSDNGTSGDYGYSHANPAMHYFEDTYSSTFFTTTDSYYNPHASSDATNVSTKLSNGTGYANYSAHCSSSGWYSPSFTTSNVSSMSNTGKYGLMIGNCCQSNKFEESECFGEALLRANNKGAIGYIGGTDYTYWYHDYYWAVGARSNLSSSCTNCNTATYNANNLGAYDRMCHTHNEAFSNWNVTQGSINYAGNMAVQSAYSASDNYVKYYWEIYELMGDPSIMPWLGQPADMNIRVDNVAPVNNTIEVIDGTTSVTVATGAPYSYIALTQNLTLVTAVLSDANGNATITFPAMNAGDVYELAASAQNYKTTFTTIEVLAGEGARVNITAVEVTNNAQAVANAQLTLNVSIENRFPDAATNTVINAATASNQITLTDATETVGTVNSGASQTLNAAFALTVSTNIADGDIAPITFTVSYLSNGTPETTTYTYNLMMVDAHLNYVSDSYTISGGNSDNVIDPGETVTFTIVDENDGHATANDVVSLLHTYYNLAPVTSGTVNIGTVNAQNQCTSTFTVTIGSSVPNGTMIPYYHHIYSTSNTALSRVDTLWITVGSAEVTEDWESGDMNSFAWTSTEDYPWEIVSSGAYAGTYCARSTNYQVNSSVSDLQLTIDAPTAGNITFYSKVSSESYYDGFVFYLDGEEMTSRSGNGSWQQSSYAITAGTHTLKFTYEKDYSYSSGSDRAWVDNITFPGGTTIAPEPEIITDLSDTYTITSGNGDADINPGESIALTITTENLCSTALSNVSSVLTTTSPYATITNANQTINIAANSTATTTYNITFAANTPDNTVINFTHTASAGLDSNTTYNCSVIVKEEEFVDLTDASQSTSILTGNGDANVNNGETVRFTVVTRNNGEATAHNAVSTLTTTSQYATISNATQQIGTIAGNATVNSQFDVAFDANTPDNTVINFTHTMTSDEDTCSMNFSITVTEFIATITFTEINHTESIISGNGDNNVNQGETVKITVYSRNDGNTAATNVTSTLSTTSNYATIQTPVVNFATAAAGAPLTSQYNVNIASTLTSDIVIPFTHVITDGTHSANMDFSISVIIDHTGINESEATTFIVYPNPTSGEILIQSNNVEAQQVKVFDVYGKLIVSEQLNSETTTIDLSSQASGLYFVRIYNGETAIGTTKVVKQ